MPYTVYKVTNLVTQDFYIGVHKTDDPDDAYLGSGKVIREQVAHYGPENFRKDILASFDKRRDAYRLEAERVEPLLGTPGCLNIHPGGHGGFGHINAKGLCDRQALTRAASAGRKVKLKTDPVFLAKAQAVAARLHAYRTPECHQRIADAQRGRPGKPQSPESRRKLAEAQTGERNSQFGTCWVMRDGVSQRIPKQDLPAWEADGWIRGRKCNMTQEGREACAAVGRQWGAHAIACKHAKKQK